MLMFWGPENREFAHLQKLHLSIPKKTHRVKIEPIKLVLKPEQDKK